MRRSILISSDLFLVASATLLAIWLRADFDNVQDKLITLLPYIFVTIGSATIVFLVSGLDRTPWRYSSVTDHLQIIVLTVLVILLTLGLTFAANRLEGVSRTLPVLQGGLIISILIFARAIARFWFATRIYKKGSGHLNTSAGETVLVVGVNAVAELYLVSLQEFASTGFQVAGILAEDPTMRGRLIRQNAVLGTVDELPNVLQSLEIHGVTVDRIVVATAVDRLLPRALEALLEIEKSSNIVVHFLSDRLGFTNAAEKPPIFPESERSIVDGQIPRSLVGDLANANFAPKPFRLKRTVDSLGAAFLMVTLAPIAAVIAVIVALDVGFPLIFWQQRPGLRGRPFRMYKFRTMRAAHDKHGTRIADAQRSSAIGRILRSTRLDELPQPTMYWSVTCPSLVRALCCRMINIQIMPRVCRCGPGSPVGHR